MDDTKKQKEEEVDVQEVQQEDEKTEETVGPDATLVQKVTETEEKYRRALADYQNLQRRTQDEKREWARFSNNELVLKLLPILDTLMLAEKHTKDQTFVLTVQQFLQVLREQGIERIKAEEGETFDPLLMEAVETRDGEEHKVLEEVKAGFRSGETVIRPAYVVVGKKGQN